MAFFCAMLEILELPIEVCLELFGEDVLNFVRKIRRIEDSK